MRFGWTFRGGIDTAGEVRRLEAAGYDYLGAPDTQSLLPDVYCVLTDAAAATQRVSLGPWATNVSTRDPTVTAGAIATIDLVSGGRAFLAIGTGRSSTANAGLKPARPEQLARALTTIFSAFRPTQGARADLEWPPGLAVDDSVVPLPSWVSRRVPVLVAASGPKALRIAAEMGDGVVLSPGDLPLDGAAARIAELRAWRDAGPRAGDPFEIHQNLRCYLTDSVEEGRAALRNVVSAHAAYARPGDVPAELREAQQQYLASYRWDHHGAMSSPVNPEAMERLGLADFMYRRYAIIGDGPAIAAAVQALELAGLDAVTGVPPGVVATYEPRSTTGPTS